MSRSAAPSGSDHADAARQRRQRLFVRGIEQAFGRQLVFELVEGAAQGASRLLPDVR